MPRFGEKSLDQLATCHPDLQNLFHEVVRQFDCTILEGHRDKKRHDELLRIGKTKVSYLKTKHGFIPSLAVDAAPWPIDWEDRDRFHYFGGYVLGIACQMGINLRWGGDWNGNTQVKDNIFDDLVHFELIGV